METHDDDQVTFEHYFEGEKVSESHAKALVLAGKAHVVHRAPHGPQGARVELRHGPSAEWLAQYRRNQQELHHQLDMMP